MNRRNADLLKKLGLLVVLVGLSLLFVACGGDSPTTPQDDPPAVNRAPDVPGIDTAAGTPANGATDVATTVTLHWTCSDADGDALTYTVYWGSTATPSAVSTDQSNTSYGPISMVGSTTFYWQIAATDPDGETTASPVWNFTTIAPAAEVVTVPGTPSGPATGLTQQDLTFSSSAVSSSLGHSLTYQFDWGAGELATDHASPSGTPAGP